jgi:hypothetical protein
MLQNRNGKYAWHYSLSSLNTINYVLTEVFTHEHISIQTPILMCSSSKSKEWDRQNCRIHYPLPGEDGYHPSARTGPHPYPNTWIGITNIGHC